MANQVQIPIIPAVVETKGHLLLLWRGLRGHH